MWWRAADGFQIVPGLRRARGEAVQTHTRRTILVVDDDDNDLGFIVSALRCNGVKGPIHVASSGSEAIAYLKGEGKFANRTQYEYPDILITDIKMPDGDGFAILEYLRKDPEHAIIPTIVFSSSDDPNDIRKSYLLGANSFHVKPMGIEELRAQLKILYDYWSTCLVAQPDLTRDAEPVMRGTREDEPIARCF
jgi:CheY-like chemotaxis protein